MAHESFEDAEVARVLNERFVSVKVDREERPDVDGVYMAAVQAMTGHGGWPMSVFLTPDGVPFFGGTYWPKDDRQGLAGFLQVLDAVWAAWTQQREQVQSSAQRIAAHLQSAQALGGGDQAVDIAVAEQAAKACVQVWDQRHGGFGRAPKFPQAMTIDFLLAHHLRAGSQPALRAATHSLAAMASGGIYDHVGGGFHRYSVDAVWLVPHFEKMLYDNALLLRAYTHAWQVTAEPRFRRIAVETADYLLRDMRHPEGAFYAATDADSEGEEGTFFVWDKAEFDEVVEAAGEDPDAFARFYGVTEGGNFEGRNILHEPTPRDERDETFAGRLGRVRAALYERRGRRIHPGLDDKVLVSWNALAIGALAETGAALGVPAYVDAAARAARFIRDQLVVDGRLQHTWREGHRPSVPAFLEDVAYLAQALLVLYEADHDAAWFNWARRLAADAESRFADPDSGAYYATAHDAEELITRHRDLWDNATPAGSSVMVDVHLRLAGLTGNTEHNRRAEQVLAVFQPRTAQAPTGYGELLRGMERLAAGPLEVAVAGDPREPDTGTLVAAYRERWRPGAVLAVGEPGGTPEAVEHDTPTAVTHPVPLLHGRARVDARPAAYVCRNFACDRPVTTPDELRALLDA
jgi:uncharacterized protein